MLRRWIENIKTQQVRYECACWKYNYSGQLLELSVQPTHQNNREKYRCAVVHIGQVIKALTSKLEQSGYRYHTQSFPNLDDPSLVASVRVEKKGDDFFQPKNSDEPVALELQNSEDTFTKISALANQEQLTLANNEHENIELPQLPVDTTNRDIFTLLSTCDNPFTWLHVGYWKESVFQSIKTDPDRILLFDFCKEIERKLFYTTFNETHYIQGVITVTNSKSKTSG